MADADQDVRAAQEPPLEPDAPEPAERRREDYLDEQEEESFPASDPHSDWSG